MDEYIPPPAPFRPLSVPQQRLLMGPGPSNSSPRVLSGLGQPPLGHMHPETFRLMDDVKAASQYALQTRNACTLAVSASGHGAMEMALGNLLEPGDRVLLVQTGVWAQRAGDMARRYGADVRCVRPADRPGDDRPLERGESVPMDVIEHRLQTDRPLVVFVAQGDSSTGVLQPIEGLGALCRQYDALLVCDTVASLGGWAFRTDAWQVDVAYTGAQKVLGAPAGLTPITFGERALERVRRRRRPPPVYYFDVLLLGEYWACFPDRTVRPYHHTISTTMLYGLREALAEFCAEGVHACAFRHKMCAVQLYNGLHRLGLELFVPAVLDRLPTVTTVKVPDGVQWQKVVAYAMEKHMLEIGGGLGPSAGRVFRIGLMGTNATLERVNLLLKVLREALEQTSDWRAPKTRSKL